MEHSKMFNFYKLRFESGKITAEDLKAKVPKFITAEEFEEITGQPYE